ncbi:MAG TPA: MarR family transcriptional regulator [Acidimicrobiia bacterium]|jgi:DNA-binding MarR family transcriptional regulator|nr:MarR family transcriptional regulator [Acidimicrobiia bacterium]
MFTLLTTVDVPPLPTPLRRTATNLAANLAEAVLVQWARRFRNVEAETRLTAERLEALTLLEGAGPVAAGDMAEALRVSRPAITRMVNGLEESGLVRRSANLLDGRSVLLRITPAGRRVLNRGRANRVRAMAARLRGRSERELAQLETGLRILAELLEE